MLRGCVNATPFFRKSGLVAVACGLASAPTGVSVPGTRQYGAATRAQAGGDAAADAILHQVVPLVELRDRLPVEQVEHVHDDVQPLAASELNRVVAVDVRLPVRRSGSERAARRQVVLPVRIGLRVAVGGQRQTREVVSRQRHVQAVQRPVRELVAAVELELVDPVVRQLALRVHQEVRVVERGVDVRVELARRVLERAVVVAFELRPHVAREELPVVAEVLPGAELDAVVDTLRLRGRQRCQPS